MAILKGINLTVETMHADQHVSFDMDEQFATPRAVEWCCSTQKTASSLEHSILVYNALW